MNWKDFNTSKKFKVIYFIVSIISLFIDYFTFRSGGGHPPLFISWVTAFPFSIIYVFVFDGILRVIYLSTNVGLYNTLTQFLIPVILAFLTNGWLISRIIRKKTRSKY